MSSIIINLATRCRPLAYRLINVRNLVANNAIAHHVYAKGSQQKSVGGCVTTIRYVATRARPASGNDASEPPVGTSHIKPVNKLDPNERLLKILLTSPVTMPFISFNELKTAIDAKSTINNAEYMMLTCSGLVDRTVAERVELIDGIWQFLKKTLDSGATLPYVTLIKSYRRSGRAIDEPHAFLAEIGAPKFAKIYEELIVLMCANNPSIEGASDLLHHLKTIGLTATEQTFAALIVGTAAQTKSMEKVDEVLLEMGRQQVERTIKTQVALIKANIECGNEQQAIEMLKQRNDWESEQLYGIIRLAAMKCTDDGVVKQALGLLPAPIQIAKNISGGIRNVCRQLLHASNDDRFYDPYELIIRHLPAPEFVNENTDHYGAFMLHEMLSRNTPLPRIVQLSEQLIASGRNTRAYHFCCGVALTRCLPVAHELLRILATREPLRPPYFWPMFAKAESEDQTLAIIKLAVETQTDFDAATIENHVLPKLPLTLNESMLALKTLEESGLKMLPLRTSIISYLLRKGRPHEALNIAKAFTGRIDAPHLKRSILFFISTKHHQFDANATTIAHLIRVVQSKTTDQQYDLAGEVLLHVASHPNAVRQRFGTTLQLIQELTAAKVKISPAAAEAVLDRMRKQHDVYGQCVKTLNAITDKVRFPANEGQPTAHNDLGSMQDMENHLIELESRQLNTRGLVRKLFLQCVKEKKYDRAMQLHRKYIAGNEGVSPAILATTIDLMTYMSNAQEALNTLDTLQSKFPQFTVDLHKIVQLADLLVKQNRLTDAESVLNRFASLTRTANTNYIKKNIWDLLHTTAEWSIQNKCPENTARMLLDKLVRMGYCEHTKQTLGPVIRELIGKGQVIAAIDEFEAMVNEYRTAPHLGTLMTLLIGLINSPDEDERWQLYELNRPLANEKLRKIIGIARELYKPDDANTTLLTSFVIAGNEQQVRKLLMNPAMQINVDKLLNNMEHQVNTLGNIEGIMKLARCNRGLRHEAINEDNLYSLLVDRFAVENNHAAALEFYTLICKDPEFKMSKKLKQKFDTIFARNNIEIKS